MAKRNKLRQLVGRFSGPVGFTLLFLLIVLGLMDVVYVLGYREPVDGAYWEMVDDRLTVVSVDLEANSLFQIGDVLLAIDGREINSRTAYQDCLYAAGIGARHHYKLIRDGDDYQPYVDIRGGAQPADRLFFLHLACASTYLLFFLLIISQNVNFSSQKNLAIFALCVFLLFGFHYTDRLTTLDWIALFLNDSGTTLLPSALLAVALGQMLSRGRRLFWLQVIHWVPTLLLLGYRYWLFWVGSRLNAGGDSLNARYDQQEYLHFIWGGSLVVAAVAIFAVLSWVRRHADSFYWTLAWLPFGLWLWKVPVPYLAEIVVLIPFILPITLVVNWSRKDDLYLGDIGKRVLIYCSSVFMLLVGYALFIAIFQGLMGSKISPDAHVTVLGIGIMFAAVFYPPLKNISADYLDRLIYGKRLESIRLLADFSDMNRADTNIDEFLEITLARMKIAFLVERGFAFKASQNTKHFKRIGSTEGSSNKIIFEELTPELLQGEPIRGHQAVAYEVGTEQVNPFLPNDYICPIRVAGDLAALLVISKGGNNPRLSPEEERLLKSLLRQCDVLMENMELYHTVHQKVISIAQLQEYNENIIESSRLGILTTDEMGRAVSCNSAFAELVGRDKHHIMGKVFEELLTRLEISSQRQVRFGFVLEGTFANALGEELLVEVQRTPLKTKENEVYGTLYLVEDIREKKDFNQKLMQQEKLASIGMLAAGVAHEINTPLTGITSYSQMLATHASLDPDQKGLLQLIQAQSQRAAKIVAELLNFSRKENHPKGPVDLLATLDQTLRFLSHQMQKRNVVVVLDKPEEEVVIDGYANQIQQVFVNLIVNAMDAMAEGGTLEISTRKTRHQVKMGFKDTGSGMDNTTRTHIFDPFYTTKEVGKGTGLGLSVVYNILQEHGATAEVRSKPGKGTNFILYFPLRSEKKIAAGAEAVLDGRDN